MLPPTASRCSTSSASSAASPLPWDVAAITNITPLRVRASQNPERQVPSFSWPRTADVAFSGTLVLRTGGFRAVGSPEASRQPLRTPGTVIHV